MDIELFKRCLVLTLFPVLALLGDGGREQMEHSETQENTGPYYTLPKSYNPLDVPWISEPLGARELVLRYKQAGDMELVVEAWPWIRILCAPTLYPSWDQLPDEMKLGSVHQQHGCWRVLSSRNINDIEQVREYVQTKLNEAEVLWGKWTPSYGRYITSLGLDGEDLPDPSPKRGTEKSQDMLITWLEEQIKQQNPARQPDWMAGETVGPFTPSWGNEEPSFSWKQMAEYNVVGYEHAVFVMNEVARKRGLAGLRLPVGWAQDPNGWIQAVKRIDSMADLIEQRSRMGKGGFGLWGEVFFDWRSPAAAELAALTVRYEDFYLIQAQEESMAHEWFHAFQHWLSRNNLAEHHAVLFDDISTIQYNQRQTKEILSQSHTVLSQNRVAMAWLDALAGHGWESVWQYREHKPIPGEGMSVYWYAQAAWTVAPQMEPGENHWIARRRLLEKTLVDLGWSGVGLVGPGYYTQPNEITAAAFQGDINLLAKKEGWALDIMPKNLISSPLPVESKTMRTSFGKMFINIEKERILRKQQDQQG